MTNSAVKWDKMPGKNIYKPVGPIMELPYNLRVESLVKLISFQINAFQKINILSL